MAWTLSQAKEPSVEQSLLAANEEVLYQTRKHWAVFIKAAVYLILAVLVLSGKDKALGLAAFNPPEDLKRFILPLVHYSLLAVFYVAALALALVALIRLFSFFSTRMLITGKRVIMMDLLSGSAYSLDLGLIESVRVSGGLLGAVLGYGKLSLVMSSSQKVAAANMREPHEFERRLFAAK
jgi:hypothetical protein